MNEWEKLDDQDIWVLHDDKKVPIASIRENSDYINIPPYRLRLGGNLVGEYHSLEVAKSEAARKLPKIYDMDGE